MSQCISRNWRRPQAASPCCLEAPSLFQVLREFPCQGVFGEDCQGGGDTASESHLFRGPHSLYLESALPRLQEPPKTVNQEPKGVKKENTFVMWNPLLANSFVGILTHEGYSFHSLLLCPEAKRSHPSDGPWRLGTSSETVCVTVVNLHHCAPVRELSPWNKGCIRERKPCAGGQNSNMGLMSGWPACKISSFC